MIDPFIIEYLRKKRQEETKDKRVPLYITPPTPNRRIKDDKDTNKKDHIEIDSDDQRGVIIIDI